MTDDPDRTVRLLGRSSPRGVYRIVLELPASKLERCAAWLAQADEFSHEAQFRFEERTGRLIRLVDWLKGLVP